jgi:predicted AAA+ superfamily ATPase
MQYIKRLLESPIKQTLADNKIAVIYGPRQVGKTTLAKHLAAEIDPHYTYLNCDEPDVASALSDKTSTELKLFIGTSNIVVIDEAQRVNNIGVTLKLLADTFPKLKVIATGSSSFELANAVNEPLTGRAYYFTMWPLALSEISSNQIEQRRLLESLLIYGSYPVVSLHAVNDITRYLGDVTTNYLYKDLLSHGVIRSEAVLVALLKALALQSGGEVSLSELSRTVGVDVATIKRLMDLLEKAFIIHRLSPLSKNLRSGIRRLNKVYFTDLGIRNYLIGNLNATNLRSDNGALWENFCVNELRKQTQPLSAPINDYFWRNYAGAEVDYIQQREGKIYPFECKWGSKKPRLPKAFTDDFDTQPLQAISPTDFDSLITST